MIYKKLFISTITLIICSIYSPGAKGQIFSDEQNPPDLKWQQIITPHFQILYPIEFYKEGQRMANTLERLITAVSKSMGTQPRKITIILQNQGVVSNGFVQLAPRRSEFFTTPPQNFDIQDWLNSLAVHELRHVAQFDKLTGRLKAPFFEELALAIFGITLPPWFFEGDAVGIETALSPGGRGRLPEWEIVFRTNTLSRKYYSYTKNYLGSLKDRTPGYYQLGYFMTSKLRRVYGKGIMDSLMTRMSKNPLRPYNLSTSLKSFTGLNTRMLHDSTLAELDQLWTSQDEKTPTRNYLVLNKRNSKSPGDFLLPVTIGPGKMLVLKEGLDKTPAFLIIDSLGKEQTLLKIGQQTESNFNYSSGTLVWDELRYDARYHKRSFNVINTYQLATRKYKQITHKSRFFSPTLSPDANIIAAVQVDLANACHLIELEAQSGKHLKIFPNPRNYILQTPSYSADGTKIVCVAISQDGAAIIEYTRGDGSSTILLPFQRQQITRPVYAQGKVVFRAHFNGTNNLYALEPGGNLSQLTSARYGASNPSYNKDLRAILFNVYQHKGYDISLIPLTERSSHPRIDFKNTFIDYAGPLVQQESAAKILDSIPREIYPVKNYKELSNLFYFHSLSPIAEENDFGDNLNIGLKLKSNNQLNTLEFYTGYQFNYGLKKSEYLTGFTYKRFYPIIDVKYTNRARLAYSSRTQNGTISYIPVGWRENFLETQILVPFVSNRLNKNLSMGAIASSSYTSRYQVSQRPARFIEKIKFPVEYQFYLNHNTQRSARDIAPKWGQNVIAAYQHIPFGGNVKGAILRFQSSFLAPGLLNNHSFQTSFNYQQADGLYEFNIDIPRVSGHTYLRPLPVRNTLLLDYRLPLFYPDAEIGTIAYIKRIRAGLFADFQNIGKGNKLKPRTYGLELSSDMNLLRFYLPNFSLSGKLVFLNENAPRAAALELGFSYGL